MASPNAAFPVLAETLLRDTRLNARDPSLAADFARRCGASSTHGGHGQDKRTRAARPARLARLRRVDELYLSGALARANATLQTLTRHVGTSSRVASPGGRSGSGRA
mmetsp:Transcript_34975/g.108276  ORF Transcript_34975/g.108276 Transcript_34975/m.108276 type:complete len:107 (-) Transcript_34975:86-406(-)